MKKTYISPSISVMKMEGQTLCEGSKPTWHVNHTTHSEDLEVGSDYGYIMKDKGFEYYQENNVYDPWNSDNW